MGHAPFPECRRTTTGTLEASQSPKNATHRSRRMTRRLAGQPIGSPPSFHAPAPISPDTTACSPRTVNTATASSPILPTNPPASRRAAWKARSAYGVALFGGRCTGTPNAGFGLSQDAREYRLGWRLGLARSDPASFDLGLRATRREPEHGVRLDLDVRF